MRHMGDLSSVGTQGPHTCVNTVGKEPGAVVIPLQALTLHFPPP